MGLPQGMTNLDHSEPAPVGIPLWLAVLLAALAAPAGVLIAWDLSNPMWGAGVVIGGLWLLVCCVSALVLLFVHVAKTGSGAGRTRWTLVVLLAPMLVASTMVLFMVTSAPMKARFAFARGDFNALVQECARPESRDPACNDRTAGSYPVSFVSSSPDSTDVVVYLRNSLWTLSFDDSGFVYAPDGTLPPSTGAFENPNYVDLGGGWYSFNASW